MNRFYGKSPATGLAHNCCLSSPHTLWLHGSGLWFVPRSQCVLGEKWQVEALR